MTTQYTSPLRFSPANKRGLNAAELLDTLNELKANDTPDRVVAVSTMDIFGSDLDHGTPSAHLNNLTVDGRSLSLKDLTRSLGLKVGGEMPSAADTAELGRYFKYLSDSLKEAAKKANGVRKTNEEIRINNLEIAQLKEDCRNQYDFEKTLNIPAIEAEEATENRLRDLQAENASLKSDHNILLQKVSSMLTGKNA